MKKLSLILLSAVALLAAASPAHAQSDPNPVGTVMLSGDFGLKFVKDMYSKANVGVAPSVAFDYVVSDSIWKGHLSVGASVGGYYFGRVPLTLLSNESEFAVNLVPRVLYGINAYDFLEIHFGAEVGPCMLFDRTDYYDGSFKADPAYFKLVLGGILGVRYMFNEHFGLGGELRSSEFAPLLALSATYKF